MRRNVAEKDIDTYRSGFTASRIIAEGLVVFFVLFYVFFHFFGLGNDSAYRVDGLIKTAVERADGSKEEYRGDYFGTGKAGDRIVFTVGTHTKHFSEAAALCFNFYNSKVCVYCDGEKIFTRPADPSKRQTGHRYYRVPLPENYADGTLQIEFLLEEDNTSISLQDVYIYPAVDADKYVISGHEFEFTVFSFILCASVLLLILVIIRSVRRRKIDSGLYMALFCVFITCWYMGFNGLFYYIVGDREFCANIEYIMIYLAPIPLTIYLASLMKRKWFKLTGYAGAAVFSAEFIAAAASGAVTGRYALSNMLPLLHSTIGVVMVLMVVFLYADTRENSLPQKILRWGITVGIVFGICELLRIILNQFYGRELHFLSYSIASFGILAFMVTLMLSFGARLADDYAEEMEKRELKRLAYIDTLTGAPNRASCYREMERMRKNGIKNYAMLFVDVNDLKKTNDRYGHEAGDRLIKGVAGAVGDVLSGDGFYGRWGGDEFIVCVAGDENTAENAEQSIINSVSRMNAEGYLPFEISAAVGAAVSTEEKPLDFTDAVNLADDRMYERKKAMKKART